MAYRLPFYLACKMNKMSLLILLHKLNIISLRYKMQQKSKLIDYI